MIPIGTLIQKMYDHDKCCSNKPPSAGPRIEPSDTQAAMNDIARPRRFCGASVVVIPNELLIVIEAPTACTKRANNKNGKPKSIPASTEPSVNTMVPILKILILPS